MAFYKRLTIWLDQAENAILVWTILGLAIIGFIQVITRYAFNYSFSWYEELGRYLGVLITFLGASIGVKTGSHFTMDLFVQKIKAPWQQFLRSATAFLSGTFCLLVVFYSWKIVTRLHGYGTTSPTMQMPMYIPYLPIPLFSLIMGARFYHNGISSLLELRSTDRPLEGKTA